MSFRIPPDLLGLEDAVALVTGGARGIGRGCALQLARAGCHVALADIDEAAAKKTADEVRQLGRRACTVHANVRIAGDVAELIESVRRELGELDVAINNVGGPVGVVPFLDYSEEQWDENFEQNLKTALLCCQAEALSMIRHGTKGRIVNVASSSGVVGAPTIAAYGAANAGVIHVTRSMAMELARYGIRVNCIVPGTHETEQIRAALASPESPQAEFLRRAAQAPPLGRLGDPLETGGVAVFLASSLSSYVTGHAIFSDGGIVHTTSRPPVGLDLEPKALAKAEGGN